MKNKNGFGLLEVLISAGILVIVTGGIIGLGNISVKNSVLAADRTKAYNLAREYAEKVKQVRDTRWIDGSSTAWNNQFDGDYHFVANGTTLIPGSITEPIDGVEYTRVVTFTAPDKTVTDNLKANGITDPSAWMVKANVNVSWNEYGQDWSVNLPVELTDWKLGI